MALAHQEWTAVKEPITANMSKEPTDIALTRLTLGYPTYQQPFFLYLCTPRQMLNIQMKGMIFLLVTFLSSHSLSRSFFLLLLLLLLFIAIPNTMNIEFDLSFSAQKVSSKTDFSPQSLGLTVCVCALSIAVERHLLSVEGAQQTTAIENTRKWLVTMVKSNKSKKERNDRSRDTY